MIGRQGLYVTPAELGGLMREFGHAASEPEVTAICDGSSGYSEGLLRFLGAEVVHSFDNSDFESATHVHDMNQPIGDEFKEGYSVVLDGGTLEHVFNFPVAIRNCMEMLRVGGCYLAITPANNFLGHGFYQFSPELYFSVLSAENGFRVESMAAFETVPRPVWRQVADPREIGERVTLQNDQPVYLLVVARRVERRPIFERTPQQSDYVARWTPEEAAEQQATPDGPPPPRPLPIRLAKLVLPFGARRFIRRLVERPAGPTIGFDPRFFPRMSPQPGGRK